MNGRDHTRWWVATALVAAGAALGALAGLALAGLAPHSRATAVMSVRVEADAAATDTAVDTAASTIASDAVVGQAAAALGVPAFDLARRVSTAREPGTVLIDVTVTDSSPDAAVAGAAAVTSAALREYEDRSTSVADEVRRAGESLLSTGRLSASAAENARQSAIGDIVGRAQGQAIQSAIALSVLSPATSAAAGGVSRPVGAAFGAAVGALLAALGVLLAHRVPRVSREDPL